MNLYRATLIILMSVSLSAYAQQTPAPQQPTKKQSQSTEARLGLGESLVLTPNPVSKAHPLITITTENVNVFSYVVYNAFGQIVELENLSGKPESTIIDLTGAVDVGTYIIRFDTDSGMVTRKFMVI